MITVWLTDKVTLIFRWYSYWIKNSLSYFHSNSVSRNLKREISMMVAREWLMVNRVAESCATLSLPFLDTILDGFVITWWAPGNVYSLWSRSCESSGRYMTLWTTHRPYSNNCCTRSANSCRRACRSALPGPDHSDADWRCLIGRSPSVVPWYPRPRRHRCTAWVREYNCSGTLWLSRPVKKIMSNFIYGSNTNSVIFLEKFKFENVCTVCK